MKSQHKTLHGISFSATKINMALSDLTLGALFISTEDIFPTKRLHQLAVHMQRKLKIEKSNLMDSIYIEHAADVV